MAASTLQHASVLAGPLRVGRWRVDPALNEIRSDGGAIRLEPKAIEVLVHLARRPGEVVSRDELLAAIWPGVVVGDDALTQAIIKLRRALQDDARAPRYIETISKRGYRLVADVAYEGAPEPRRTAHQKPVRRYAVLASAALALIAALVFIAVQKPWPIAAEDKPGSSAASIPRVAVLPLSNLSGAASRDYFSDGITDDIINALGRFPALRVMSRNAVESFRTQAATPEAIRRQLGARYVVKGSIREAGSKLRISIELSDAENGTMLWSDRYDGEGRQILEIQDRIVTRIAAELAVKVAGVESRRASSKREQDLEAYDLVLRARQLLRQFTRESNRQARLILTKATQLAPDFAEAHVSLASAEYERAQYGWREDPQAGMAVAESHALRALALEDTGAHARAHAQLARIYTGLGDHDRALEEASRAIELNPSDTIALYARGSTLLWLGRIDEAIAALETAQRLDPGFTPFMLAMAYYTAGRDSDALAHIAIAIAQSPDLIHYHVVRTAALGQLGRTAEAAEAAERLRRLDPFSTIEQYGNRFRNPQHAARLREGLRKAGY